MAWLQKCWALVWAALVVLYTTRTEWIIFYVILLLVEVFVTFAYARGQLKELPRTIVGYLLAVVVFVAFVNAFVDTEWMKWIVMSSITASQVDAIVTKLGRAGVMFEVWSTLKERWTALLQQRVRRVDENLPQHHTGDDPNRKPST